MPALVVAAPIVAANESCTKESTGILACAPAPVYYYGRVKNVIEFGATKLSEGRLAIVVLGGQTPPPRQEFERNYSTHVSSNFRANSMKTNDEGTCKVTHKMACQLPPRAPVTARAFSPIGAWHAMPGNRPWLDRAICRFAILHFSIFHLQLSRPGATAKRARKIRDDLWTNLKEFVTTPSVSGYEQQLTEKIRAKVAAFHPVVDNLGDVIVTIGSGAPHRLIVTPIDEPGFVVSGITDDGYLRLQRLPQAGNLPPIFNALYSAQPVKIRTASGKWIDGVVAGISVHLHRASETRQAPATSKTCTWTSARLRPLKRAKPAWTFSAPSRSTDSWRACKRKNRRRLRR